MLGMCSDNADESEALRQGGPLTRHWRQWELPQSELYLPRDGVLVQVCFFNFLK